MVCSHSCGAEEGTTMPLFHQAPEGIWNESPHPPLFLHLHSGKHSDRLHHCLEWKQQQAAIAKLCKWVMQTARHTVGDELPFLQNIYTRRCMRKSQRIISDSEPPKPWTIISAALRQMVTQYPNTQKPTEGQLFHSDYQAAEHSELTLTQHTSLSIPFTMHF